ncbi:ATP-binding cassette domain-containing protein [Paenibacillus sp. 1P07SE]|uniref:ATP-binding cassette domain-containing protein n=1 Tax=Paenibacillus sp. 1P07SE TaxID=3132209 RepID=UPI0039A73B8C
MGIIFDQVSYSYPDGPGLVDVDFHVKKGTMLAVLGAPGSGKSTLLQHMNGLLLPARGSVQIDSLRIEAACKRRVLADVRKRVGLIFQYPEQQLFEETVEQDLCFGPVNFGASEEEAAAAARRAAQWVGLEEAFLSRSPAQLSSGERRRAAIASVLASEPDIVALDEPTASLDAAGRADLMSCLARMCREEGKTVIVATHRIEDVAPYAQDYIVLQAGRLLFQGDGNELLRRPDVLEAAGVTVPAAARIGRQLSELLELVDQGLRPDPAVLAGAIQEAMERRGVR